MKIDSAQEGGRTVVRLSGRLDREWAEQLSNTLEDLLQSGVRSLSIDFSGVTYVSSAATMVLAKWRQELSMLRGDVRLTSLPPAVNEISAITGWDPADIHSGSGGIDLRRSSWHSRADFDRSGQYELAAGAAEGTLACHLHGDPARLEKAPFRAGDCSTVAFPNNTFGVGVGAIGGSFEQCHERLGELIAVAGCVAHFPSDGARMADYLVGGGQVPPSAVLAEGLTCEGDFSQLLRFSTKGGAEAVPLSELATVALEAVRGRIAGVVIAGETLGLCGARLRRSPAGPAAPVRFDLPAVRDWLLFSPERTHSMMTTLIAGVVAREPGGSLGAHLRPLGGTEGLYGHFHAAVFSYRPLPQRTVDLGGLVRALFTNHQLRDVLHLLWDERGSAGVGETALVRGVGWVGPVTEVG
jgi:anti-anti-sigma factor